MATWTVGLGETYATLSAIQASVANGDLIEIVSGADVGGITLTDLTNVTIRGKEGHRWNNEYAGTTNIAYTSGAIIFNGCSNCTVSHLLSTFATALGDAIVFNPSATNLHVSGNLVFATYFAFSSGSLRYAVHAVGSVTTGAARTSNAIVRDCVVHVLGAAITAGFAATVATLVNVTGTSIVQVQNCLVVVSSGSATYGVLQARGGTTGTANTTLSVQNTAVFGSTSGDFKELDQTIGAGGAFTWLGASHNASADSTADNFTGSGHLVSQTAAQWFVNVASDLSLDDDSPGVDAGTMIADNPTDALGVAWGTTYDIGPFSFVGTSSTVTLDSYALATLDELKRHLHVTNTDDDTLLTEAINRASAFIETVTGRKFKARDYRERLNGQRQRRMRLGQWPVNTMNRVAYGHAEAMTITFTGSAIRANASVTATGIKLTTVSSTGVTTSNHLLFTTYPSLSVMETAIELISGWSVSVTTNMPSADLNRTGGEDALNRSVSFHYPDNDATGYTCDYERGVLTIDTLGEYAWDTPMHYMNSTNEPLPFPRQFQGFLVEYNAGFETIPADLTQLAIEIAAAIFYAGVDSPLVKSTTLGQYSVEYTGESFETMVRRRLAHYIGDNGYVGGY